MCTFLSIHLDVLAQPTDNCNSGFTGEGIPVSDQCNPRGFNVMNNYTANYNSGNTNCNASNRKDAYWWFQGTGGTVVIRYKPTGGGVTAGYYNPTMSVFTGTCASNNGGAYATCTNDGGNGIMEVITMETNSNTKYRIRIQNISSDNSYTMYGQICVMSLSTPNSNNRACDPYQLAIDSTAKPNYFQLSTFGTTTFSQTPSCGSYNANKRKAYFTVTMPSTDLVIETEKKGTGISTNNDPGYVNTAMTIYKVSGSGCGNETYSLVGCYTGGATYNMARRHIPNGNGSSEATTGTKLLVIVWSENNNTSYFGISAYTSTQCGNPLGLKNDFCENPAQMYKAPGTTFSASTSGVFTPDIFDYQTPYQSVYSLRCTGGQSTIYVHNNSWYEFEADTTTEVFPFSADCQGIQAVIYQVSYTAQGCCSSFIQKSNCISQMAAGANAGTITATGLTPGNKYLLMVDGYAGAQCNFTIRNWNAVNILLGINLLNFSAEAFDTYNTLRWTTSSETNNDYFTVLKSTDGYTWEEIEKIEGAGTSNKEISYETYDQNLRLGTIYYKLKQTDFDGEFTYSNIIVLNRGSKETGIITVAPNPTAGEVTINILNNENEGFITVTTLNGQVVYQTTINNKGIHAVTFDMEDMPQGVYLVNYKDASTQSIRQLVRQ